MDRVWYNEVRNFSVKEQWDLLYDRLKIKQKKGKSVWGDKDVYRNSENIVDVLPPLLKELDIKTFTDIGCGDFLWLSKLDWSKIKYLGYDIVQKMIDENRENYKSFEFNYMNLIETIPPKSDMIFLRSVLIHTSLDGCLKMIKNIKKSGSKYLMASTLPHIENNGDTSCLWLVKRNLELKPFNFPKPIHFIKELKEDKHGVNNYMGVWKIEDINSAG